MTNYQFLQKYLDLQNGVTYSQLTEIGFAKLGYCQDDSSPFWNLALVNNSLSEEQLIKIESYFKSLDRKSTVYFESRANLNPLVNFLEQHGYKKINEDSWMFYEEVMSNETSHASAKEIKTEEDLKTFLRIFDASYQRNDPQNPYGELGDYLKLAERAWHRFGNTDRLEYFLIFKEGEPVAVSTLTSYDGIGYISNVGSLRSVRGQGYGKAATLHCVTESIRKGNKLHCLATEEGTYPNEFYNRIGFKTKFTSPCYTKS